MQRFFATIIAVSALSSASAFAADPAPDTLLAKKGEIEVTAGDFLAFIARLPQDQQFTYRADLDRISHGVSSIFLARTLAQEAREDGIDKDPAVQRRLQLAQEQLLAQLYLERFEKSIKTPDFEAHAQEVYKADQDRFKVPERVRFNRILVSFQGRSEEEAKLRAEEARAKLVAGMEFTAVAREYTNDPTFRSNNGTVSGTLDQFGPTVAPVLRTGVEGTPSVVRTDAGYYVIVLLEHTAAHVLPYEKVKKSLIESDEKKYRTEIIDKKLASITQSKDVTLYTDNIAALKTEVDQEAIRELHEEVSKAQAEQRKRLQVETPKPAGQ